MARTTNQHRLHIRGGRIARTHQAPRPAGGVALPTLCPACQRTLAEAMTTAMRKVSAWIGVYCQHEQTLCLTTLGQEETAQHQLIGPIDEASASEVVEAAREEIQAGQAAAREVGSSSGGCQCG